MTPQQELFAREYLVDFHGTNAAIRAGYSKKSAYSQAHDLLKRPEIRDLIKSLRDKALNKYDVSKESVIAELAKLAFSNVTDFATVTEDGRMVVDVRHTTRDQFAAVSEIQSSIRTISDGKKGSKPRQEVSTKLKLASKREALRDLGQYFGLFKDEGAAPMNVSFHINGLEVQAKKVSHG